MGSREALIVATGAYQDAGLRQLRSPAHDAAVLGRVLSDPGVGDFRVRQIVDETEVSIRRAIFRFFADRSRDDVLLLHISCHGIKDDEGQLYFAATDTTRQDLQVTAVSATFLNDQMARCRARSIMLFLDCCYAGAFAKGSKGDGGVHLKEKFEGHGRAILTASNSIEYAWEGDTLSGQGQPSVFTSAIVDGLASGDADRDGDGEVSLHELHEYVTERMLAAASKQTPLKWEMGIEGTIYVAHNPRPRTALPRKVREALEHPLAGVRAGVVTEVAEFLLSSQPGVCRAARNALEQLQHHDDSFMVRQVAGQALNLHGNRSAGGPIRLPNDREESTPDLIRERPDPEYLVGASETDPDARVELRKRATIASREILRLSVGGPWYSHSYYGFNQDGSCFALGVKGHVQLFDVWQAREVGRIQRRGWGDVFAFSPDGGLLATSINDKTVVVWDVRNTFEIARLSHRSTVHSASFSPTGDLLATAEGSIGGDRGYARLWDLSNGEQVGRMGHKGTVYSVAFSADGSRLATASTDKSAALWDTSSGGQLAQLKHQGTVLGVEFSFDGTRIVTQTESTLRLWDVARKREVLRLKYRKGGYGFTFSPDGTRIVTWCVDEAHRLSDAMDGRMIAAVDHHDAFEVAFSPDGRRFATTGEESSRIWDSQDGHEIRRIEHSAQLLAGGSIGTWLATSSDDGRLRIWNEADGREIGQMQHDGAARLLHVSRDERCVATAEEVTDGECLRLWQLSPAELES